MKNMLIFNLLRELKEKLERSASFGQARCRRFLSPFFLVASDFLGGDHRARNLLGLESLQNTQSWLTTFFPVDPFRSGRNLPAWFQRTGFLKVASLLPSNNHLVSIEICPNKVPPPLRRIPIVRDSTWTLYLPQTNTPTAASLFPLLPLLPPLPLLPIDLASSTFSTLPLLQLRIASSSSLSSSTSTSRTSTPRFTLRL